MALTKIENLTDDAWDRALASLPDGAELLQSDIWQNVAKAEKFLLRRFAWRENGDLAVLAQVMERVRFGFKSWYLPRGPILLRTADEQSACLQVLADLKQAAFSRGAMSMRFEPENWSLAPGAWGKKIKSLQPEKSLFLDLSKDEAELLAQMHPKTRYNIRLAEKKGVEIIQGKAENLKEFWDLLQITVKRDSFRGHSFSHYQELLAGSRGAIELWLARREGRTLAAGLFSFYGGRAVYLHGASADEERRYMAPYLLQWRMIQRARSHSCRYYDFYGIDERKWPGVTRFKRGFGGEERVYPGTFLLVVSPWRQALYDFLSRLASFIKL